eukprot:GGOE01020920.1.p2 GENE.GGOE01020920.1~~GGOE01020920.1.p2  ORF type:complete len:215 (+),score=47.76 GGOE01020920.1:87-731(+)
MYYDVHHQRSVAVARPGVISPATLLVLALTSLAVIWLGCHAMPIAGAWATTFASLPKSAALSALREPKHLWERNTAASTMVEPLAAVTGTHDFSSAGIAERLKVALPSPSIERVLRSLEFHSGSGDGGGTGILRVVFKLLLLPARLLWTLCRVLIKILVSLVGFVTRMVQKLATLVFAAMKAVIFLPKTALQAGGWLGWLFICLLVWKFILMGS